MSELWDIYDKNRKKTGKVAQRGVTELEFGKEYHIVVAGVIMNSKNEILISQRAAHKHLGLQWELNGGSIISRETSLEGILRELKEELGLEFSKKEAIFLKEIKSDELKTSRDSYFKDLWLFRKDINVEDITFPDKEAIAAKWVSIDEFIKMYNNGEIVETVDFGIEEYNKAITLNQREAYEYIGKNVRVEIDRKLGTKHPKHGFEYELNYGYVPNTISGDGEELDCYVLGIDKPVEEFEGKCIAVIHRTNDDDDKLIVVPEDRDYLDEEIRELTSFQEKYFESEIIR